MYVPSFVRRNVKEQLSRFRQNKNKAVGPAYRVKYFDRGCLERLIPICQLCHSFIVCRLGTTLVCIDQHAAHERIRFEKLLGNLNRYTRTFTFRTPPCIQVKKAELEVSRKYSCCLKRWFRYKERKKPDSRTSICGNMILLQSSLLFGIKLEASDFVASLQKLQDSHGHYNDFIPDRVKSICALRSCRGSFMFGDILTKLECSGIVREMLLCSSPYVCAHLRPTCVPFISY